MTTLQERIKKLRSDTGLTQREITQKLGIPLRTWGDWETGRRNPPEYVINLIEYKLNNVKEIRSNFVPKENNGLNPIIEQIRYWRSYQENRPAGEYKGNEKAHDDYRRLNDRDCVLTDGNLLADTIFSLWRPLKMSLQCSSAYPYKIKGNNVYPYKQDGYISKAGNFINFLSDIENNLDRYLPQDQWKKLYDFASLSLTRANVMILPDRGMNTEREKFLDQMPPTLYNCFKGGDLHGYFKSDKTLIEWLEREKLEPFFDGELKRENINPLIKRFKASECGWLEEKEEIDEMLSNYINILDARKKTL